MGQASSRLYPIKSHEEYSFFTGFTLGNQQLLMGLLCPSMVAIRFDSDGNLLRIEERPVPFFQGVEPPYNIYDDRIPSLIADWQKEMAFQPAAIKVKKFFSQVPYAEIEDYPNHLREALNDPRASKVQQSEITESIRQWEVEGDFVLWLGNEYWLNNAGEVVST